MALATVGMYSSCRKERTTIKKRRKEKRQNCNWKFVRISLELQNIGVVDLKLTIL
jgi:hypothetical protein